MKKNIVLTGANGFVGQYLSEELRKQNYNIVEITSKNGSIVDFNLQKNITKVDHVIHLAAKTFVPDSWNNPYNFYDTNIMGTANVLEFCRHTNSKLTFLSTYIYGQPTKSYVDESHPINPNSPYNHSKVLAESLCKFYSENFNVPISILRPFNIYGPGQKTHFLIPEIIRQCMDNSIDKIEVMDLKPKRDYLHVRDLVNAISLTLQYNNSGLSIYNVGSGISVSVEEIIKLVLKESCSIKSYSSKGQVRKNEVMDIKADITKIKKDLKWEPTISLRQGIEEMLNAFNEKSL
ncbi:MULTISPECIES: NAD-dependent epimerase/dehydratase family protein [unclassified Paenibacillus]|uniref:NAD-dependent epimerase/dehydratase family protein n=1 Tax=unclassified Paenibacillus TaxID=185978 RepID=UPI003628C2D8